MSIKGQIYVAVAGAAGGLVAVMAYWVLANPQAEYHYVAIGALVYATGYILVIPRMARWLRKNPSFVAEDRDPTSRG
jgi:hypothetical protein